MYSTNIFYVSDDPHFSAKHFDDTIKYQVKNITPFDINWLAVEEDIKNNNNINVNTSTYAYFSDMKGVIPEFKIPGNIISLNINKNYIGYKLSADGNYVIDSNFFNVNNLNISICNIKSTITYNWGQIDIEHIIKKLYNGIQAIIKIVKTVNSKIINKKRFSNKLVDYFSKFSNHDTEIKYGIKLKVHSFDLGTWMNPINYNNISNTYIDGCSIIEIKNNEIIDYNFDDKPAYIDIDLFSGDVSINQSKIIPTSFDNNINFQIELWTNDAHYKGNINILYDQVKFVGIANITFTNSTRLDNSVFIDGMGMLKSSVMKMVSRHSKEFECSKIPIINQLTESYKQSLEFKDVNDIKYGSPIPYYPDSQFVNQTTLNFNQKMTGVSTKNFKFQPNGEIKHLKNIKSNIVIYNYINSVKSENSNGYSSKTYKDQIHFNNEITNKRKIILKGKIYYHSVFNDALIFSTSRGDNFQFNDNNIYSLFNKTTHIKFITHKKVKTNVIPELICHEIVHQHPIIQNIPVRTLPNYENYTNGFKWDYIGFVHTGAGKYFTNTKQYGAIHDLDNWLFPLTWIYNRLTAKYEGIDLDNYVDNTTMRDYSINETVKNYDFNNIPIDYYIKFRKEFEEKFMNNTHGQQIDRVANSKHIDDRYGINNHVVTQFYRWVWDVLWKHFNSNTNFNRFVEAIIKFGVPLIIEAYYMYDYEGDGFQRFHMNLISEISKEIKSKFIRNINGVKYHNRNIIIYNSYFRKRSINQYHNYFGKQFSRVTNIFTVKLYNELAVNQKRITNSIDNPAWLNYFNNFYNNYDFDILIPYKDTVIKYDKYYIDKREDGIPYKIYNKLYPKVRGVDFKWSINQNAFVDALYAIEDNYNPQSDVLHTYRKLIPVNYSHHDSIHIMQNKLYFDDYSMITGHVEKLTSTYSKYNISNLGYIMRNTLTRSDYLSINTLPSNTEIFLNLQSLNLTRNDDIESTEAFFNFEMNPAHKKYNRLNAIIHDIDELSTDWTNEYNMILLKYLKRFMVIFDIRDGKLINKEKINSIIKKAINLFSERLVIYLNCYTEEDYLIGRIIAQRISNLLKIEIAINIVDHVKQNKHIDLIEFKYSNQLQTTADMNLIYIKNSNDDHSILSIYKEISNSLYLRGTIDSDVLTDTTTTGWGTVNLIELLSINEAIKNESELYITGKIDNTLVEYLKINVIKL